VRDKTVVIRIDNETSLEAKLPEMEALYAERIVGLAKRDEEKKEQLR
jgi:hypothetical protein